MRTIIISNKTIWLFCGLALAGMKVSSATAQDALFQSRQITPPGEYTFGIEGPAVDARGNLYVVNFGKPGTIGKVAAGASQSELFGVLPQGSVGNASRFCRGRQGRQNLFPFRRFQSAERFDRRGRRHDLRERSALETARRANLANIEVG